MIFNTCRFCGVAGVHVASSCDVYLDFGVGCLCFHMGLCCCCCSSSGVHMSCGFGWCLFCGVCSVHLEVFIKDCGTMIFP